MNKYVAALGAALLVGAVMLGSTADAQQTGSIKITSPANGASTSGPVMLSVDIQGVTVKAAAEGDPAAYHYHALVDVDPATVVQPGQPLPTGQANIIHTANRTVELPNLSPGQHTVTVVLTRTDHVPLTPAVTDKVSFTVTAAPAGAQAPAAGQAAPAGQTPVAAPRVGTGGGIDADTRASLPLLIALAVVLMLSAGVVRVRARSGSGDH